LQDEIALSVVGALEPSLRQAEMTRVARKRHRGVRHCAYRA
jgi:hypothetical protein